MFHGNGLICSNSALVIRLKNSYQKRKFKLYTHVFSAIKKGCLCIQLNQVGHLMCITQTYTRRREPFMPSYWTHFFEKSGEIRVRDSYARKRVEYRV